MKLIVKNAKYELTAVKPNQYPASNFPEVAFAGRSNVGKSSLINTLLNRKNLARVGATPGKTREINFYNIDDVLYFVDLPGYGYANVSKEKKSTWGAMMETYLNTRQQLRLIILLVDIRHKPSDDDRQMFDWIRSREIPYIITAMKADKISRGQIRARTDEIRSVLGAPPEAVIVPFSADSKLGRDELWRKIDEMLGLGSA
jgi:GTP-binding protein